MSSGKDWLERAEVGVRLREARSQYLDKSYSAAQLASALKRYSPGTKGISTSSVYNWERGFEMPDVVVEFLETKGLRSEWLLRGEGPPREVTTEKKEGIKASLEEGRIVISGVVANRLDEVIVLIKEHGVYLGTPVIVK